jgi:hypothetical protein
VLDAFIDAARIGQQFAEVIVGLLEREPDPDGFLVLFDGGLILFVFFKKAAEFKPNCA